MNQILANVKIELEKEKKYHFKYFFIFSISILALLFAFFIFTLYRSGLDNKLSKQLQYNYETMQLYASSNSNPYTNLENSNYYTRKFIIGKIEIPSLEISYPIFSMLDDETLKISPCIFYGKMPPENGNLCIAGHNYNNSEFFSSIEQLKKGDTINIYDINNHKYSYSVFNNYEVKTDDLSPIYSIYFKHELTLVTCNNFNNQRIIIKASY